MSTKKKRPIYEEEEEEASVNVGDVVKGIIAVMVTALVVIIVIMLFAKSLFVSNASEEKKTGKLTAAPNYSTTTTTTVSVAEVTKKSTTTRNTDIDPYQTQFPTDGATSMTVNGDVRLHPEPTSKSDTIVTIPAGAKVTAYALVNNSWLYVEYNGKVGYAYGDYFDGTKPSATTIPT